MAIGIDELGRRFRSYVPGEVRAEQHRQVRDLCLKTAEALDALIPDSREKSLVMTRLEEVMFWANAGIARNGM